MTQSKPPKSGEDSKKSEIGTVLANRYEVLRELGRGGMGVVYLCKDIVSHERVALKRLRPPEEAKATRAEESWWFQQEARAVASLDHPAIVRARDFGSLHDSSPDADRLVMPLLTSVPLAVIFYSFFYLTMGVTYAEPFFVGFGLGYLAYDGTHYAVHHFKQTTRIGKYVKRHHMLHHHMDHDGGFGVSSPLWDIVFRTMPKVQKPAALKPKATDTAAE